MSRKSRVDQLPTIYELEVQRQKDFPITSLHADYLAGDVELASACRELFTGPDAVRRLRDESGLRSSATPSDVHWTQYRRYTHDPFGVSGEAVALTLYYLAAKKGLSGKRIDFLRDSAEYVWDWMDDDPGVRWQLDEDGDWVGNPATAPVVFRAVNLAYDLEEERNRKAAELKAAQRAAAKSDRNSDVGPSAK
ncbi:unnamed protein product [Peniophora sp. CBMAI 1063]|nr:unnamed protein product [Peniophora sp. CBMAI 1063]